MNTRDTSVRGQGCNCSGYPTDWPHRKGSKYCWFRSDGSDRLPGDPDFSDRNLSDEEIAELAKQYKAENVDCPF